MNLDPTQLADWQIAEVAEIQMQSIETIVGKLGVKTDEWIPQGKGIAKLNAQALCKRLQSNPVGKYIDITAITPTPLGEGKTTTTLGLVEGLAYLGKKSVGAIRQPSGGPTFNIKGSAAGGGRAQCIPLAPFALGLTGDIDAITNAHNLCMVALSARMQHEHNYDDDRLKKIGIPRLDIDPSQVQIKWAIDFCAQALRNITIGQGGKMDGFEMESGFQITVSSELMAILAIAEDLKDMRKRIGRMVVARSRNGREITTADLEVDGAMTALMLDTFNPTLVQSLEGNPVLVHAGPFANIAIGQNSVIADKIGIRLGDYLVTESGFGADIGFEKFWNLKCRYSGLTPDAVVIVATVRALKMHGGGPDVKPGKPLERAYTEENVALLQAGCSNLIAHIQTVLKSGSKPVVCINSFHTDTPAEHALIKNVAEAAGARCAVSEHWLKGGEGASELAQQVIDAAEEPNTFAYLYENDTPIQTRVEKIATEIYGADAVDWSPKAQEKLKCFEADCEAESLGICMVKTHLSLSHDPTLKGAPTGWRLPIQDLLVYRGAGFIVPVAGDIKLMPGTGSNPGFRRIDVDTDTGKVTGLF
ncbi:MAG TPA: formate--tetrahydrofolate ligase [Verrucomicrobia bacterium]|nr:formate--tetrahydrofolate ligase [Verrucomicrobiota bacterium]